ncbi:centrosomal protein of 170 kDa-like isoform X5 [Biomphalaria glabrata]|uniref:Centrosomal protein of 170 kDa-like isoform X5 n=1 Tax=Biomphalaria glabrata TaxID=6526 RepID=A0A9W2ZZN0_BIOGL|nr:centrosomal protein of 170 kDa-like isoform X5 [Biomphalaria glabrata]
MENRLNREGDVLQDHWYLVDTHGQKFRLPKTMLFLGREECDVVLASQSVDKRHAVLTFDLYLNKFKVKDLSTTNGTYVNNSRIAEQEYVTLHHMDSIRLGHDTMMYHIEQGSQITNQGGQLPDPQFVPSWVTRHSQDPASVHVHAHAMAECQELHYIGLYGWFPTLGCIAEQNIEHTCSLNTESKGNKEETVDHEIQRHSPHQPHHQHYHSRTNEQQVPELSKSKTAVPRSPKNHHSIEQEDIHQNPVSQTNKNNQEQIANQEQDSISTSNIDDSDNIPVMGRNTWPRKRVRQVAHVGSLFNPEPQEKSDLNISEARPAGKLASAYIVSFDDSVCNGSSGAAAVEAQRRLRGNRASELATVKKGTPLYGQPDWWGDANDPDSSSSATKINGEKTESRSTRPASLHLVEENGAAASSTKTRSATVTAMDSERVKYAEPTYMEIPIKDEDHPNCPKELQTPSKSVSSSLSRDSLSNSPEIKPPVSSNKAIKSHSPSADLNSSMSFTIDFDDPEHPPKKTMNICSSLSEFVPSKIRKNFRERKAQSSKASSKESTPSKNSEERELSPLHYQKLDEIQSQVFEKKGKSSRLSSTHATIGTSLRSPNLEDIDRLSEFSEDRRSNERDGDKTKKTVSSKSPQILKMGKTAKSSFLTAGMTTAASSSLYSSPASYLFDKMFETGSSTSASSDKEMSPEQTLYKEAAGHDRSSKGSMPHPERELVRPVVDSITTGKTTVTTTTKLSSCKEATIKKKHPVMSASDNDLLITEDAVDSGDRISKDDKEDKVSEAGTYTIEADVKDGEEEEEEARKRIDKVFGVDVDDFTSDKPTVNPLRLASPGGYDNVYEDYDNAGEKTPLDENGSAPIEDDLTLEYDDDDDDDENNEDLEQNSAMPHSDGVQTWVKQLAALSHKSSGHLAELAKNTKEDNEPSLSKKPPQGLNRKRPGTGRKLPSIPTDKSPVSSEHSSFVGDHDRSVEDMRHERTPDLCGSKLNGTSAVNGRSPRISSQAYSRSRIGSNGYQDNDSLTNVTMSSPSTSARSRSSVDTELLLQDTETVMAAMEARIVYKSSHDNKRSQSTESDTDVSSTVALVNGDEHYVKPTLYKSPRDALSKRQQKDSPAKTLNHASSTPPAAPGKKMVGRSYSQTVASRSRSMASPRSITSVTSANTGRKSLISDVLAGRRDSFDNDSIISDVSSDTGDGSFSRSSSKGKGNITMTKPNRAFQLRRARADSFDEPSTPRSGKSLKSGTSSSSIRSSSVHSTTRTRSLIETQRSEATSLGAQIVRKSRVNNTLESVQKANSNSNISSNMNNKLGQKMQRASSLTMAHQSAMTAAKREPTPKSHIRTTPTGLTRSGLAITGLSSRSQSQPGSRSNSPKNAERLAWKRRKEYDPRKAVAEAKAKVKEPGVTMRPKPSASANIRRRMIRSASFTDSHKLALSMQSATSSTQDFTSLESSSHQEGPRRAFIPFQGSLRSERSHHSADEDDSLVSANTTQDSSRSLISLSAAQQIKSAFTPPLLRSKTISPDVSPLRHTLSLHLRNSMSDVDTNFSTLSLVRNSDPRDSPATTVDTSPQASYDSLIVSSLYQISLKLKTTLDKLVDKLRDQNRLNTTPSPYDDYLPDSSRSEMPAWKTASPELAGILKHLRTSERSVHMINSVLFPDDERTQQIKQIRSQMAVFVPIEQPRPEENECASPEMEELSGQF